MSDRLPNDLDECDEPMRLQSNYAGTAHWVSTYCGTAWGATPDRTRVQIADVMDTLSLDLDEAVSLHQWLDRLLSLKGLL